jgi:hypothetical protein
MKHEQCGNQLTHVGTNVHWKSCPFWYGKISCINKNRVLRCIFVTLEYRSENAEGSNCSLDFYFKLLDVLEKKEERSCVRMRGVMDFRLESLVSIFFFCLLCV